MSGRMKGKGWGGSGLGGKMNKACLLPGSRRQRQKNLGDRDMLVPWGE